MKRKMSLKVKNYIESIAAGICWFVSGFCEKYDTTPARIIIIIASVGIIITIISSLIIHSEEGDEMSELHYLKAKARVHDSLLTTLLIMSVIDLVFKQISSTPFVVNWLGWIKMFIGVMQIASGFYFARFEKRGESWHD